jgi:hypothetical protein
MARPVAMIALGPDARLSPAAIADELARQWPALPRADAVDAKEETVALRIGFHDVIAEHVPVPIPWSDLDGPCATSGLWTDAAPVLRPHTTHLVLGMTGEERPLDRMRLLTQATAAVLATCPKALGVFWPHAALVIPSSLFQSCVTEFLPERVPLLLWVDFRIGTAPSGQSFGFTSGMAALGHREIETLESPEAPGALRDRFHNLARRVLESGPALRDGEIIGAVADDRVQVVASDSAFGHPDKVLRLEYTPDGRKTPWWRLW